MAHHSTETTLPPRISVEQFFNPPERAGATISPDGTRIAYLAPWRNRLNIWVQDLDGALEGWFAEHAAVLSSLREAALGGAAASAPGVSA